MDRLADLPHPPGAGRTTQTRSLVGQYVNSTYNLVMDTKTERWTLRVTAAHDTLVRHVLQATGMSLNEYVVSHAVSAAAADLADRQ